MTAVEVLIPKEEVVLSCDDYETVEDPISTNDEGKIKLGTKAEEISDGNGGGPVQEAETLAEIEREVSAIYCGFCNYVTDKAWNLRRHNLLVHGDQKEVSEEKSIDLLQCPRCPATFSKANSGNRSLNRHIQSIHKMLRFTCNLCDKTFGRKDTLKIHKKRAHSNSKGLINNVEMHNDDELLPGNKLVHNNNVVSRKKISTTESSLEHPAGDRIQCPECPATFSKANSEGNNSLNRHLQTLHSKIRFTCDLCGKSFGRKDSLKLHKNRIHSMGVKKSLKIEEGIREQSPEIIVVQEVKKSDGNVPDITELY